MAKSCMVNREIKRIRLVKKFSTKRAKLKAVIKNTSFKDHRGFYWTTWKKGLLKKEIDISTPP